MSAMMNNSKRTRGGRMAPGSRDKRQMYSQQDSRRPQRTQNMDKNVNIDGIFKNQRFTHVVFTLVGSNVQVQVKNGKIYEGILKTISPKGDTVLEFAHMVEDSSNGNNSVSTAPSRERIMDKLIVKAPDLVTINAVNVDLEYAVRDSFTDTGISKYNGETKEKEMKELQPWDSEGGVDIGLLEDSGRSSNGWDVNDMFHINATQFNVKSSYDESLPQYTTKLEKENSEEWKRREEQAMRLAAEIEGSETYKKHIALENGEGDDEEALFSSVVRPNESSIQSSGSGGSGKYIPPNLRGQGGAGVSKPQRGNYNQQSQPSSHSTPPGISRSVSNHQQSPTTAHPQSSSSSSDVNNVNGDSQTRSSVPTSTAGPTVTTSPAHNQAQPSSGDNKHDHNPQYPKAESKKMMKGRDEKRDEQIKELKEFSSKFKLDDNKDSKESKEIKDKDKEKSSSIENKDNSSEERSSSSSEKVSEELQQEKHSVEEKSSVDRKVNSDKVLEVQSSSDSVKPKENPTGKKQLNPNAMEFVPKQQQQQQQQPPTQQIPTPPRPQTQSPIIQPQPLMNIAQPVFPSLGQQYIMPPANVLVNNSSAAQSQQLPYNVRPTKRAVVSVMKQDYTASAVQAATGQPLLAQSQQYLQYMPMMPPQHTGYHHQVRPQMMSVQTSQTANQRFMTPTSMQGMPPTSLQGAGLDQTNPGAQAGQVFGMMTNPPQPTPMPAHMPHPSQLNQQAHISHLSMTSSQQSNQHIQAPPTGGGHHAHHHPAPSPVLTNSNQQPLNPGQHPPSSGTPQPPPGYQQATLQAHPPLQPSPHNPTSPQNMAPYVYNTPHPMQMQQQQQQQHQHQQQQGSVGGNMGQQMSMSQQSNVPTSVTYSLQAHQAHSHHSPHMQPQYVMMPPHHSGGQMHQFQGHHMAGPGSIQPQIMSQSGVQGIPGQSHGQGPHPPTMQQFIPPVQHPSGQPVQSYQPPQ